MIREPFLCAPRFPGILGGLLVAALACTGCSRRAAPQLGLAQGLGQGAGAVRIILLHHSTGENVWEGGVPGYFRAWNRSHGTRYEISEMNYPGTIGGHTLLGRILPIRVLRRIFTHYPWDNYPYDYWNLWISNTGDQRDRGEMNLDELVRSYDVIVFKHCFPVSDIEPGDGAPSVSSRRKTIANYQLQYQALKARMHQFPGTKFIVWTGAARVREQTEEAKAERARAFAVWVKTAWDEKGDNIFLWDFRELETDGGLYLKPEYADTSEGESEPAKPFAAWVAPLLGRRIVDVIEGRGDGGSLTGQ